MRGCCWAMNLRFSWRIWLRLVEVLLWNFSAGTEGSQEKRQNSTVRDSNQLLPEFNSTPLMPQQPSQCHLLNKSQHITEPESSLAYAKEFITSPYFLSYHLLLGLPYGLFRSGFPKENLYAFLFRVVSALLFTGHMTYTKMWHIVMFPSWITDLATQFKIISSFII